MKTSHIAPVLAALALAGGLSACGPSAPEADPAVVSSEVAAPSGHVDAATFLDAAAQEGVTLIDVRTPAEFAAGHLDGALNVDVESADFSARVAELDPDATYAVYCRSANRSRVAEDVMRSAGIGHVFGLEGGVSALDPSLLVTD